MDISTGNNMQWIWKILNKTKYGIAPTDTIGKAGNYSVKLRVNTSFGCTDSVTKMVVVYPNPTPNIYFTGTGFTPPDQYGYLFECKPDTFVFYKWQIGSAGNADKAKAYVYFSESGKSEHVYLEVTDNCKGKTDSLVYIKGLTLYLFPNSFTPNSDGHNDGFGIAGPEYIKQYKLRIFNRWGEEVFFTQNPYELWKPQNPLPGLYVYKAAVQDIYSRWKEVDGVVYLLR